MPRFDFETILILYYIVRSKTYWEIIPTAGCSGRLSLKQDVLGDRLMLYVRLGDYLCQRCAGQGDYPFSGIRIGCIAVCSLSDSCPDG
jgi:hypothetical protein